MQPETCSTTYQCAFQWPSSIPPNQNKGNHHPFMERPQTAPQNQSMNLPDVCKEFAKSFDCGCKKNSNKEPGKKRTGQCLHVNVFMPYQVNFNNIPASKKKGKDGLNAYIYGSERKEALQAAALKCTKRPEPTMKDINKKIDIKLRPKTAPMRDQKCAPQHPSININEDYFCLTLNDFKNIAEFIGSDQRHEMKKLENRPHTSSKNQKPKNSCNCGKL